VSGRSASNGNMDDEYSIRTYDRSVAGYIDVQSRHVLSGPAREGKEFPQRMASITARRVLLVT
jgi:hypothetical protein